MSATQCDIHPQRDAILHLERTDGACFDMCMTAELDALLLSIRGNTPGMYAQLECGHTPTDHLGTWHHTQEYRNAAEKVGLCRSCLHRAHKNMCRATSGNEESKFCGCVYIASAYKPVPKTPTMSTGERHLSAIMRTDSNAPRQRLNDALLHVLFAVMDLHTEDKASPRYSRWLGWAVSWLRESMNGTDVPNHS